MMRRTWYIMCALICAWGFSAPLGAQMAGQNTGLTRLTDRDDLFGWEAVGRVDMAGSSFCTGVLIAPDLVLTAAHCLYDRQGKRRNADSLTFRAGLRDGRAIAERVVARYVAPKAYDPRAGTTAKNIRHDAALLQLADPVQTQLADPFVLYGAARKGQRVSVVSYGRDRDAAPSWQRECGLLWHQDGLMAFDCNVTYGSSGAPVFSREGRRARILSLVSSGTTDASEPIAYGMDLSALIAELKRDLRAMPALRPAAKGFRRVQVGSGTRATGAKFARP